MNIEHLSDNAKLAMDAILQKPTNGIPTVKLNIMEHCMIERLAGVQAGDYKKRPEEVYCAMQKNIGVCMLDQYIPRNPLLFDNTGCVEKVFVPELALDGIRIDSPEAVVEHLERFVFPSLQKQIVDFDQEVARTSVLDYENKIRADIEPEILLGISAGNVVNFPKLGYYQYGYENYFMAYALYPEIIEQHFSLQADLATLKNTVMAQMFDDGIFPPYVRADHDMADSSGMLVNIESLDKIWFPHFVRCMDPLINAGVKVIWHCDGNLNDMLPRLLDVGFAGFQGFQYEDGMDYERICKMKTRDGDELMIIGGVSVTRTLPNGTPDDVQKELKRLVDYGPRTGLFLGASSSIAPGVPWENIKMLVEGLKYYRERGRG